MKKNVKKAMPKARYGMITKGDQASMATADKKPKVKKKVRGWDADEAGGNSGMAKKGGSIKNKKK